MAEQVVGKYRVNVGVIEIEIIRDIPDVPPAEPTGIMEVGVLGYMRSPAQLWSTNRVTFTNMTTGEQTCIDVQHSPATSPELPIGQYSVIIQGAAPPDAIWPMEPLIVQNDESTEPIHVGDIVAIYPGNS